MVPALANGLACKVPFARKVDHLPRKSGEAAIKNPAEKRGFSAEQNVLKGASSQISCSASPSEHNLPVNSPIVQRSQGVALCDVIPG
jgi:hypothetical protein